MDIIEGLQNKRDTEAHKLLLELEVKSAESNVLYSYFDDFLELINSKSSFVRTRGFALCCAQAKWDCHGKLEKSISKLLTMLDDNKPTAVRMCLSALHGVLLYKPELSDTISAKLNALDLSKYKDSMRPLIEKDIVKLRELLE